MTPVSEGRLNANATSVILDKEELWRGLKLSVFNSRCLIYGD
jgi:hypothetical protein